MHEGKNLLIVKNKLSDDKIPMRITQLKWMISVIRFKITKKGKWRINQSKKEKIKYKY